MGILYDKERLERGHSTENVAYADITENLERIREKRRKLEEEIAKFKGEK